MPHYGGLEFLANRLIAWGTGLIHLGRLSWVQRSAKRLILVRAHEQFTREEPAILNDDAKMKALVLVFAKAVQELSS